MALRWKVCGITRVDDARAAVAAGADALGFVFYPPSPRAVDESTAATIIAELPREVWRVGVFVNVAADGMNALAERIGLDFLQLSGDEPPECCRDLSRHAIKALRLGRDATHAEAEAAAAVYEDCTLLIDTGGRGEFGGTGRKGNWEAAAGLARSLRVMLAGGLTAENVGAAIDKVGPWAVDVSSGVESRPGKKDPELLAAFSRALAPYRSEGRP